MPCFAPVASAPCMQSSTNANKFTESRIAFAFLVLPRVLRSVTHSGRVSEQGRSVLHARLANSSPDRTTTTAAAPTRVLEWAPPGRRRTRLQTEVTFSGIELPLLRYCAPMDSGPPDEWGDLLLDAPLPNAELLDDLRVRAPGFTTGTTAVFERRPTHCCPSNLHAVPFSSASAWLIRRRRPGWRAWTAWVSTYATAAGLRPLALTCWRACSWMQSATIAQKAVAARGTPPAAAAAAATAPSSCRWLAAAAQHPTLPDAAASLPAAT